MASSNTPSGPLKEQRRQETAQPLGFLDLPPEIRNAIYEYRFVACDQYVTSQRLRPVTQGHASRIAILQTCRQIRDEAQCIFYFINRFWIDNTQLEQFLSATCEARLHAVVHLTVNIWSDGLDVQSMSRKLSCLQGLKSLEVVMHTTVLPPLWKGATMRKAFRGLVENARSLEKITVFGGTWGRMSTMRKVQALLQGMVDDARAGRDT